MLYTFRIVPASEPIPCTVSVSFNSTSRSFVVTDSENTFEEYKVDFYELTPKNLKYRCEVISAILGDNYSIYPAINISENALDAIELICETNRLFF